MGSPWPIREFTICNERGLHARALAKFVRTAEQFNAELTVSNDDVKVGGTSVMGLMLLAASKGCTIKVQAIGPDAEAALDAIEELVNDRFGEAC